jgi:hypothetical protein
VIASVGGDGYLGRYVSYLDMFGVPWAIICDGKALHPRNRKSLARQLSDKLTSQSPAEGANFETWRNHWATHGIFTLAESFDEEVEAVLKRGDPQAWEEAMASYEASKVRAARAFAESAAPPDRLGKIYTQILEHLGLTADSRS